MWRQTDRNWVSLNLIYIARDDSDRISELGPNYDVLHNYKEIEFKQGSDFYVRHIS